MSMRYVTWAKIGLPRGSFQLSQMFLQTAHVKRAINVLRDPYRITRCLDAANVLVYALVLVLASRRAA